MNRTGSGPCGQVIAGVRRNPMNPARRRGSHAEGCYEILFFVDDRAIKVFKRQGDSPPDHTGDVFYSEVEAYLHSAVSC